MPVAQVGQTGLVAWSSLIGEVGQAIPPPLAKQIVAQAWRTICRARAWGFLRAEGYLLAPAIITGTVTFTFGQLTCVPDATLIATLDAIGTSSLVGVGKRAIRDTNNVIYQIRGYDGVNLTLNRPYLSASGSQTITIFEQFYTPPITEVSSSGGENIESPNIREWRSVVDTSSNQRFLHTDRGPQWLDRIDPTRMRQGDPTHLIAAPYDVLGKMIAATGTPLFELWPHYNGTTERIYICKFIRDYTLLSDDPADVANTLPQSITLKYLLAQAKVTAYEWAEANKGKFPALAKSNWLALLSPAGVAQMELTEEYLAAQRADESLYPEHLDESLDSRYRTLGYGQGTMPGLGAGGFLGYGYGYY